MTSGVRASVRIVAATAALTLLSAGGSPSSADVRLPNIIGSSMVLQRDKPLPIWGWANPGEEVTVHFAEQTKSTTAGEDGRWKVTLAPMPAGGPFEMTVSGNNRLSLENIQLGEVWVCSGQSNMQWPLLQATGGMQEALQAEHPRIRLFSVPRVAAGTPSDDVEAAWQPCSPKTAGSFSAVGYFFGRSLHEQLNVPVGLINSSWGGTRIEPWTPPAGFRSVAQLASMADRIGGQREAYKQKRIAAIPKFEAWLPIAKRAARDGTEIPDPPAWPNDPIGHRGGATGLYNGMIHPLLPLAIRGAIWYQGEANRNDGMLYHLKMKALIQGWRSVWDQGEFPFYYVQLAPFRYGGDPAALARCWEAQTATLSVPNTGMVVTTDIGNLEDIHPKNKQDVGRRLALWALAKTYGRQDLVYSGPLYRSASIEGNTIRVEFDHTGSGLASRDGQDLSWFTIAGEDQQFVPARASVDGDSVVVWSDKVAEPKAVRFGWNQLAEPNLMNAEGLPATPFRTDKW